MKTFTEAYKSGAKVAVDFNLPWGAEDGDLVDERRIVDDAAFRIGRSPRWKPHHDDGGGAADEKA